MYIVLLIVTFVNTILALNIFTMVNTEDFIKRLEQILDYYSLNASIFADKIGVQRSSISHLLSGRNKPSLDFVLKISEVFPEVDLYWLLNGKGEFPRKEENFKAQTANKAENDNTLKQNNDLFSTVKEDISTNEGIKPENVYINEIKSNNTTSKIEKIVIFYENGLFKEYNPL